MGSGLCVGNGPARVESSTVRGFAVPQRGQAWRDWAVAAGSRWPFGPGGRQPVSARGPADLGCFTSIRVKLNKACA